MEITRGDRDGSGPLPLDGVWELSVWAHSFARPEFSFGQNTNKLGELAQLARLSKVWCTNCSTGVLVYKGRAVPSNGRNIYVGLHSRPLSGAGAPAKLGFRSQIVAWSIKSEQREGDWRQLSRLWDGGLHILPQTGGCWRSHCLTPVVSVFLLEGTGLTQLSLPLRGSLLPYVILITSTYLQTLWPGRLSFNQWSLSVLSSNHMLWGLPDIPRSCEVQV